MHHRLIVSSALALAAAAALAQEPTDRRDDRVRGAVADIVATQFDHGEAAAIAKIQACYQTLPEGRRTERLDECLGQDIAYSNLSTGMYRDVLKHATQPPYATSDAMKQRVLREVRRAGLSQQDAEALVKQIGPVAVQAAHEAVQGAHGG